METLNGIGANAAGLASDLPRVSPDRLHQILADLDARILFVNERTRRLESAVFGASPVASATGFFAREKIDRGFAVDHAGTPGLTPIPFNVSINRDSC